MAAAVYGYPTSFTFTSAYAAFARDAEIASHAIVAASMSATPADLEELRKIYQMTREHAFRIFTLSEKAEGLEAFKYEIAAIEARALEERINTLMQAITLRQEGAKDSIRALIRANERAPISGPHKSLSELCESYDKTKAEYMLLQGKQREIFEKLNNLADRSLSVYQEFYGKYCTSEVYAGEIFDSRCRHLTYIAFCQEAERHLVKFEEMEKSGVTPTRMIATIEETMLKMEPQTTTASNAITAQVAAIDNRLEEIENLLIAEAGTLDADTRAALVEESRSLEDGSLRHTRQRLQSHAKIVRSNHEMRMAGLLAGRRKAETLRLEAERLREFQRVRPDLDRQFAGFLKEEADLREQLAEVGSQLVSSDPSLQVLRIKGSEGASLIVGDLRRVLETMPATS